MKIVSFGGGCNVGQAEADVVKEAGGDFELLPEFDYVDAAANRYNGVTAALFRRLAINREVFVKLPDCIAAARYGAGLEAVDLEAATDLGILIVSNHTYGPDAVSSWAKSLFHAVRGEIHAWHQTVLVGDWRNDYPIISKPISTLTAGVVGLGTIGQTLVPQLQGEFKRVVGYDLYADKSAAVVKDGLVELMDDFESLLEVANVVFIHCAQTPITTKIFNKSAFERLPQGAYIVNCARGGILDENALVDALESGHLGGAAMDVYGQEPPILDSRPFEYARTHRNLLFSPHIAGLSTEQARINLNAHSAEVLVRAVRLQQNPNLDWQEWPKSIANFEMVKGLPGYQDWKANAQPCMRWRLLQAGAL